MSDSSSLKTGQSWHQAWLCYTRIGVIRLFFLGFSAGLPYLLVFSTLTAWLRDKGVALATIGFFGWVGITYSVKFLWSPIIDSVPLPLLHVLGRRRSWMLLAQLIIAVSLASMAVTDPVHSVAQLSLLAVLVAFASATQDIAIDAFRIDSASVEYQAAMSAMYIFGYRLALLFAGAGAFYIADFYSWTMAYFAMSALMGVGVLTVLLSAEPTVAGDEAPQEERLVTAFISAHGALSPPLRDSAAWLLRTLVCPFVDFFVRNGTKATLILALIGVYKLSDITMGAMANPFYLDMGFSKTEIANVAKVFGFFMVMAGTALGGVLVVRFGLLRTLLLGAILVAITNLLFALMAVSEPSRMLLAWVISADNISGGIATVVFVAYLSSLVNQQYTATQYAIFSSFMTLPAKFLSGFSGLVVEATSYGWFFIYSSLLGLPAILLVAYFLSRDRDGKPT